MPKLALSGAAGFFGQNIIGAALESGIDEIVAISSRTPRMPSCKGVCFQVISTEEFIRGGFSLGEEFTFINCLFPTNADGFKMADGLEKAFRVIDAAYTAGVRRFVNISSQSVYDTNRNSPAVEDDQLCLDTPYAVGKYCTEQYCLEVFKDCLCTNIRLASLIGVGYEQRISNRLIDQILDGKTISISGGAQRYGLLDVRDAADGILALVKSDPDCWRPTYNLGSRGSITLLELVELIVSTCKKRGIEASYVLTDGGDTRCSEICSGSFLSSFKWTPKRSLSDSVSDILEAKLIERGCADENMGCW